MWLPRLFFDSSHQPASQATSTLELLLARLSDHISRVSLSPSLTLHLRP